MATHILAAVTTQQDLADRLGLSVAAVSMALTGRGRLAESTRQRVLAEAARLGYRLDANARAMRTGRTGLIGLLQILPETAGPLIRQLLLGVVEELGAHDSNPIFATLERAAMPGLESLPPVLRQRRCDGFLVNHHLTPTKDMWRVVGGAGLPVVWMNNRLEANAVYIDDEDASHRATCALIAAGQRRLGYMDYHHPGEWPARAHHSVVDRRAGYVRACREAGVEPRLLVPPDRLPEREALAFTRAWMERTDAPTTVLTYGGGRDVMYALLTAAGLGRRVPEDIGVVQFSGEEEISGLRLDTVLLPFREVGRRSAAMLLRRLDDQTPEPAEAVPTELRFGVTTVVRPPA